MGDLYVDDGASGGDGSRQKPFSTIGEAVNKAAPGQKVVVRAGTYREKVTVRRSVSLLAEPGATIKGSDVWTGWTQAGAYWTKAYSFSFAKHGKCRATSNGRCLLADGVYINGAPQFQETSVSAVGPGEFFVGGGRLYLGSNPAGRTVEVVARSTWVDTPGSAPASNVTVKGFTMTHAAAIAQHGAITDEGGDDWLVEGNDLSYSHGLGVKLNGDRAVLRGNRIHHNGHMGVGGSVGATGQLIEGNEIAYNTTEDFSTGWEGGGAKWARAKNLVIRDNESHHNDGPGLWCDIQCDTVQFVGNRVHHNGSAGISYEVSDRCLMEGNLTWENGWYNEGFSGPVNPGGWAWGAGIRIHNSNDCELRNNVAAWNADGLAVMQHGRPDYPAYTLTRNNVFTGNVVAVEKAGTDSDFALAWLDAPDARGLFAPEAGHRAGPGNRVYRLPNAAGRLAGYAWGGRELTLEPYRATPGGTGTTEIARAELTTLLAAHGMPTRPER